jgi:hypothetical protein
MRLYLEIQSGVSEIYRRVRSVARLSTGINAKEGHMLGTNFDVPTSLAEVNF